MKIFFVMPEVIYAGGIQRYSRYFVEAAIQIGHDVASEQIRGNLKRKKMVTTLACEKNGKIDILRKALYALKCIIRILKFKPDFIICMHVNFSAICYYLLKIVNIKYAVVCHGIEMRNIYGTQKEKFLKKAYLIYSVSKHTKSIIEEQIPEVKGAIKLIPPAIDGKYFFIKEKPGYLKKRHNLNENNKVILTVARLHKEERYKGYDKVIDILPELLREIPSIKYIVVGSGSDMLDIKKRITKNHLEDSVILTGYVPDNELVDYYNLCDVFVMPSKGEGFGIVFLEAIACGKPVVAGNKDGARDALLNGEAGVLVAPDNNDEIKAAIINVLKRNIPQKLIDGRILREKIIKEYGLERFKRRVTDVLDSIV